MDKRFTWQVTLLPILFIVITAATLTFFRIHELRQEKEAQIEKVTTAFIDQQKEMARDRVMVALELIRFQSTQTEEVVRKRVKERVDEVIHIANAFYQRYHDTLPRKEMEEQLKFMISHAVFDTPNGYFFAVDMNTEKIIIHKLDKLIGYSMSQHKDLHGTPILAEQKMLLSRSDGAFQKDYFSKPADPEKEFPKLLYVRYFKPFNWLIGTGEYLDDMEKRLQENVLTRLKALYSGDNNSLVIQKMNNLEGSDGKPYATLLLSSNPANQIGKPLFATVQDSKGNYHRKEILKTLRDHGEGFVSYWHSSPVHGRPVKKTAFFFYDKTWNWTIGSGFYYDVLENELINIENRIEQRMSKEIRSSIAFTLLIIVVMSSIFFVISRRISKTIQSYATKLEQAQKMESIGTLAGGIAHDFNNILSVILGYTEMAKDDCTPESSISKDLGKVLVAANRAKGLVQQILAFSRQDDMERIHIQPASIVQEVIQMLRPSLPTTIEITQNIDAETGLVFVDPSQLNQILMNLCTNAFHAMEDTGGTLDISLQEVTLSDKDLVHETDVLAGTFIQISIGDSGTGITPTVKNKIFEPYFTTKETGKGTGMGLSMVHGIVKNYGGCISFHSDLGVGTVFHVFLPIVEQEVVTENEINNSIPGGGERILFVDDEEQLARMGKNMLERLGYHVTVKSSSLEALETFQRQPDQFDIVITDQTMPGMTGADLAHKLMQIKPEIPIILCTGYSTIISEEKAKAMGIKEFAFKPLAKKDIAILIRKALDVS